MDFDKKKLIESKKTRGEKKKVKNRKISICDSNEAPHKHVTNNPIRYVTPIHKRGAISRISDESDENSEIPKNIEKKCQAYKAYCDAMMKNNEALANRLLSICINHLSLPNQHEILPFELAVYNGHFYTRNDCSGSWELSLSNHNKYASTNMKWDLSFGDNMPLVLYVIFNFDSSDFLRGNPKWLSCWNDIGKFPYIVGKNGKTLLMYAIENFDLRDLIIDIIRRSNSSQLSHRDNFGLSAVDYLLRKAPDKRDYKYESECMEELDFQDLLLRIFEELDNQGANMDGMVEGNPATLPIHMAAYYGFEKLWKYLSSKQNYFSTLSRSLFYAIEGMKVYFNSIDKPFPEKIDRYNTPIIWVIMYDMYIRHSQGFPIHKEEINLMNQILQLPENKDLLECFEKESEGIKSDLEGMEVYLDNKKMSLYELLTASHKIYYKAIATNETCYADCDNVPWTFYNRWATFAKDRLEAIKRRVNIFKEWEKISYQLMKSFHLPYDCVRFISEYLTNDDLKSLTDACLISYDYKFCQDPIIQMEIDQLNISCCLKMDNLNGEIQS